MSFHTKFAGRFGRFKNTAGWKNKLKSALEDVRFILIIRKHQSPHILLCGWLRRTDPVYTPVFLPVQKFLFAIKKVAFPSLSRSKILTPEAFATEAALRFGKIALCILENGNAALDALK
jgi:hypothetical protein